jgi:hypothetical protein
MHIIHNERKGPLERSSYRYMNNIKMDLKEIWWKSVDWIYLAQDKDQ